MIPTRLALVMLFCGIFLQGGRPQKETKTSSGVLVDGKAPGAYITYVQKYTSSYRTEDEGGVRAIFHFHNNYRFTIEISVYNVEDEPILVGNKKEDVVGVTYDLFSFSEKGKELPKKRFGQEILTGISLDPGEDILFSVPVEHVTKFTEIWVPFRISAENGMAKPGSGPEHFAVFMGEFMPVGGAKKK